MSGRSRHAPTVEVGDTYRFLLGRWRIERTFTDHRLQETGVFSGTACVARRGIDTRGTEEAGQTGPSEDSEDSAERGELVESAEYREVGQLRFAAYRGTARRSLTYVRLHDGAVTAAFEDGRRFVTFDLRSGTYDATHLCNADRYDISWSVLASDAIVELWRARGPSKDYEARCVLRRLREPGPERGS